MTSTINKENASLALINYLQKQGTIQQCNAVLETFKCNNLQFISLYNQELTINNKNKLFIKALNIKQEELTDPQTNSILIIMRDWFTHSQFNTPENIKALYKNGVLLNYICKCKNTFDIMLTWIQQPNVKNMLFKEYHYGFNYIVIKTILNNKEHCKLKKYLKFINEYGLQSQLEIEFDSRINSEINMISQVVICKQYNINITNRYNNIDIKPFITQDLQLNKDQFNMLHPTVQKLIEGSIKHHIPLLKEPSKIKFVNNMEFLNITNKKIIKRVIKEYI